MGDRIKKIRDPSRGCRRGKVNREKWESGVRIAGGGGGGGRGVGGGIAMSSIGGLNFPAVWGWPLVAPGNQRI